MRSEEDWSEETPALVEEALGYTFRDKALLKTCFTHSSYAGQFGGASNERLEFLGDAVLGLCITEELYLSSGSNEGTLTELRKQFVSRSALEKAEERAGLMRFLRFAGREQNVGGKTPSNLVEAVVAGIYLDGGMAPVRSFLGKYLSVTETENYKSLLQEYVQERSKTTPAYSCKEEEGSFFCRVEALGQSACGRGGNKKSAETEAAKALYHTFVKGKA